MRLGLAVSATTVRGVVVKAGAVRWLGSAAYSGTQDLVEVIGQLAAEAGAPRRAAVALERDVVQLRTVLPAPPVRARQAAGYVALEAPRLFVKNGAPLVTDGQLITAPDRVTALWAGAVEEPLVRAVLDGCAQAGLDVDGIGPAADFVPHVLAEPEREAEVVRGAEAVEVVDVVKGNAWRSRLPREWPPVNGTRWLPGLAALGETAPQYAAAFGASIARPRLALLPDDVRVQAHRRSRGRLARIAAFGVGLWLLAGVVYVVRLSSTFHSSTQFLDASRTVIDSALAIRRELGLAQSTLAEFTNFAARRPDPLALLAAVTAALPDSIYLVLFRINPDGVVRLAGYAPLAGAALAALERVPGLRQVRFEGPVTRESVQGVGERDRFAITARMDRE